MSIISVLGEMISGSEGESGGENEEDIEEYMKEQQSKLDQEKEAIMKDKTLLAEVCVCGRKSGKKLQ